MDFESARNTISWSFSLKTSMLVSSSRHLPVFRLDFDLSRGLLFSEEGQLCPALHGEIRKSISDFFVGVMAGSQLVDCESLQTVGYQSNSGVPSKPSLQEATEVHDTSFQSCRGLSTLEAQAVVEGHRLQDSVDSPWSPLSHSVFSVSVSKRNLDFGELFADPARPRHFRTLRRVRHTFMDWQCQSRMD